MNSYSQRQTALFEAAKSGDYETISHLLRTVYQDGLQDERYYAMQDALTPLHAAAINGHHKCLQILLDHGANIDDRDNFTTTALHRAAENGNALCVKALLDAGADCSATIYDMPLRSRERGTRRIIYIHGATPLRLAVENRHIDCVIAFLNAGADIKDVLILDQKQEMLKALIHSGVKLSVAVMEPLLREHFSAPGEMDIFKCLVKHLPVLPRIGDYNIFSYVQEDLLGSTLPDNIEIKFSLNDYANINDANIDIRIQERGFENRTGELPRILNLSSLREPLLGVINNSVAEELESYERDTEYRDHEISLVLKVVCLVRLRKQLWYEQMASKPRTLQDFCRLTIQKHVSSFEGIKKLPLPELIKSHLLDEQED